MTATVVIEIEVEPADLVPCGPVQMKDGLPDVVGIIEDRLKYAFSHVHGFGQVDVKEVVTR